MSNRRSKGPVALMRRAAIVPVLALALSACAPTQTGSAGAVDLRGTGAGLAASDYVAVVAHQAALSRVLGQRCVTYRFDRDGYDRHLRAAAQTLSAQMTPTQIRRALDKARANRVQSDATAARYIKQTGVDFANPASICNQARKEVRNRTAIGSMLKRA